MRREIATSAPDKAKADVPNISKTCHQIDCI